MRLKVLVKEKIAAAGIEMLKELYEVDVLPELDQEGLINVIGEYDALIVRSATQVTADVLAAADHLKIVGRAGIGVDNVDVAAATKRGVIVANAPQSNIISAAEHTVALLMAQARNIPQANESLRSGKWERSKFGGVELMDKTLAVIGLGRIGTLVASRTHALGMKLVGYDPYLAKEKFAQLGVERYETIDELLPLADFITVHLPKTKETIGMFSDEQFAKVKDGVRLVNAARGGIFDEDALIRALESGKVAGAAIDVWEKEPVTDSKLFAYSQVVVTPHLGASTTEAQDKAGVMIAEQVIAALSNKFVSNAVNIAPVPAEVAETLQPYLPLCEYLGKALVQANEKEIENLELEFTGPISEGDTKLLTIAVLKGIFEDVVEEPVNYVNAGIVAAERGIKIRESKQASSHDYVNLISVKGVGGQGDVSIAGTLIGKRNEPRFVRMYDFDIDMVPSQYMAFFRYEDRPGMIGKVGSVLGEHDINIASMQVGRKKAGGRAVMGVNIDSPISPQLLKQIEKEAGIDEARAVNL